MINILYCMGDIEFPFSNAASCKSLLKDTNSSDSQEESSQLRHGLYNQDNINYPSLPTTLQMGVLGWLNKSQEQAENKNYYNHFWNVYALGFWICDFFILLFAW